MPKFLVIGDMHIVRVINVEVEAKDFAEAEERAVKMAKGQIGGLITMHQDSSDITVKNISVSQRGSSRKRDT